MSPEEGAIYGTGPGPGFVPSWEQVLWRGGAVRGHPEVSLSSLRHPGRCGAWRLQTWWSHSPFVTFLITSQPPHSLAGEARVSFPFCRRRN